MSEQDAPSSGNDSRTSGDDAPATADDAPQDRVQDGGVTTCAECGTPVDEFEWYPIRGERDEDGEFLLHSFCSQECVESWELP